MRPLLLALLAASAAGSWTRVSDGSASAGPEARYKHAATLSDGSMMVYGGLNGAALTEGLFADAAAAMGDLWRFRDGAWTQVADLTSDDIGARFSHSMVELGGELLVFGGLVGSGLGGWHLDDALYAVDAATGGVTELGDGPYARMDHAMVAYGDEQAFLFGGLTAVGGVLVSPLDDLHVYDDGSWTAVDIYGPSARYQHDMAVYGSTLVLYGGVHLSGGLAVALSDVWTLALDGELTAWAERAPSPGFAAASHALVVAAGSRAFSVGDCSTASTTLEVRAGDLADGDDDHWWHDVVVSSGDDGPAPRVAAAAVLAADGENVLLFGGYCGGSLLDADVWALNVSAVALAPALAETDDLLWVKVILVTMVAVVAVAGSCVVVSVFCCRKHRSSEPVLPVQDSFHSLRRSEGGDVVEEYLQPPQALGVPAEQFLLLPMVPAPAEGADCCSICLADYDPGEPVKRLPCDHLFHGECIGGWLRHNRTCPLCKGVVGVGMGGLSRELSVVSVASNADSEPAPRSPRRQMMLAALTRSAAASRANSRAGSRSGSVSGWGSEWGESEDGSPR